MSARRRVILYGRSVILGTLGASLAHYAELEAIPLTSPLPGVVELEALKPDVVLFDSAAGRPQEVFSLLEIYPNLMLIGVNAESGQIELWSSGQGSALTTDALVRVISQGTLEPPSPEGQG